MNTTPHLRLKKTASVFRNAHLALPLLLSCAIIFTTHLLAQNTESSSPPAPSGPPWNCPKPPASWSVSFIYTSKGSEAAEEARPTNVEVTVLGDSAFHAIQFRDRKLEVWQTKGRAFISEAGSPVAFEHTLQKTIPGPQGPDGHPLPTALPAIASFGEAVAVEDADWTALPELSWVKPEMFKGKIPLAKQIALIYADVPQEPTVDGKVVKTSKNWPEGPLAGIPLQPGMKALAVDEETRLPIVLQLGDVFRKYAFKTPEVQKIELPAKVLAHLEGANQSVPKSRPVSAAP
jgi:hypothetical protein